MPLPKLHKVKEYELCSFCEKITRYRNINHVPCCLECYHELSDSLDKPITDGSDQLYQEETVDNDNNDGWPLWLKGLAVAAIAAIALYVAKCAGGLQ